MLKDGRTNVHDKDRSGQPSVVNDDLVKNVDQKICERWCFTISELSCEFPQISRTVLYQIITVRLGYRKFCARWVLKKCSQVGAHKMQRMASASTFLERYRKNVVEFLSYIVRVAGDDETWVSFVNVETKQQLKQWMHTHSPNKSKNFKRKLSVRKLMTLVFWDRKRSADSCNKGPQ
jgi:hypothetical protein